MAEQNERLQGWSEQDRQVTDFWSTQLVDVGTPFVRALWRALAVNFLAYYTPWWIFIDKVQFAVKVIIWAIVWIPESVSVLVSYLSADLIAWGAWDEPYAPNLITLKTFSQLVIYFVTAIWTSRDTTGYFTALFRLIEPLLYMSLIVFPLRHFQVGWISNQIIIAEQMMEIHSPYSIHWAALLYIVSLWKWPFLFILYVPLFALMYRLCPPSGTQFGTRGLTAKLIAMIPWLVYTMLRASIFSWVWIYRQTLKTPYWIARRHIRQKWQPWFRIQSRQNEREEHRYAPLEPGEIRVLEIDRIKGEIECRLVHTKLSEAGPYDAISYTWGKDKAEHGLVVDGQWFTFQTNAFELLQDRATFHETRRLWLDCICINQNDVMEKEVQIPLMSDIYSGAKRTIVYLGNEPDAEQVLSLLLDLEARPWSINIPNELPNWGKSFIASQQNQRPIRFSMYEGLDPRFRALAHLLVNEWFSRIWIFQEVIFSNKIHVRAGGIWIDWKLFSTVMKLFMDPETYTLVGRDHLYGYMHKPVDVLRQDSLRLRSREGGDENQERGIDIWRQNLLLAHARDDEDERLKEGLARPRLSQVLSRLWGAKATDPRDMIYGLLNVSREAHEGQINFVPDYSLSSSELYLKFAHIWIANHEVDKVLHHAGIGHGRKIESPSWVPDWTCLDLVSPLLGRSYRAGSKTDGESKVQLNLVSPQRLSIKGIILDIVSETTEDTFSLLNFAGMWATTESESERAKEVKAQTLAETLPQMYEGGKWHSLQPRDEAFWRCLIGDAAAIPLRNTSSSIPAHLGLSTYKFDLDYERPAPEEYGKLFEAECRGRSRSYPRLRPKKWAQPERDMHTYLRGLVRNKEVVRLGHDYVEKGAPNDPAVVLETDRRFTDAFASTAVGRKFAVTESNRMALVPRGTIPGDIVCVFLGMEVPYLLRETPSSSIERSFQLVGECYVHGIMDGEGLKLEVQAEILLV